MRERLGPAGARTAQAMASVLSREASVENCDEEGEGAQGGETVVLVNLGDVADLVVLGARFGEATAEVEHARLATLEEDLSREVLGRVVK